MASAVYFLCALTAILCAWLLLQAYLARGRYRLLLWSGLCFVCLSVNNLLLFFDLVVFPTVDLRIYRSLAGFAGVLCLLYGFVWEAE